MEYWRISKRGQKSILCLVPNIVSPWGMYNHKTPNIILLEKVRSSDGLPSAEVMQEISKLIDSQKEKSKSRHASDTPEPSLHREENGDA